MRDVLASFAYQFRRLAVYAEISPVYHLYIRCVYQRLLSRAMTSVSRGQSVTYARVRNVISQPVDRRQDFQVMSILPWFRRLKHTKLLAQLKPGNTQLVTLQ